MSKQASEAPEQEVKVETPTPEAAEEPKKSKGKSSKSEKEPTKSEIRKEHFKKRFGKLSDPVSRG